MNIYSVKRFGIPIYLIAESNTTKYLEILS